MHVHLHRRVGLCPPHIHSSNAPCVDCSIVTADGSGFRWCHSVDRHESSVIAGRSVTLCATLCVHGRDSKSTAPRMPSCNQSSKVVPIQSSSPDFTAASLAHKWVIVGVARFWLLCIDCSGANSGTSGQRIPVVGVVGDASFDYGRL